MKATSDRNHTALSRPFDVRRDARRPPRNSVKTGAKTKRLPLPTLWLTELRVWYLRPLSHLYIILLYRHTKRHQYTYNGNRIRHVIVLMPSPVPLIFCAARNRKSIWLCTSCKANQPTSQRNHDGSQTEGFSRQLFGQSNNIFVLKLNCSSHHKQPFQDQPQCGSWFT